MACAGSAQKNADCKWGRIGGRGRNRTYGQSIKSRKIGDRTGMQGLALSAAKLHVLSRLYSTSMLHSAAARSVKVQTEQPQKQPPESSSAKQKKTIEGNRIGSKGVLTRAGIKLSDSLKGRKAVLFEELAADAMLYSKTHKRSHRGNISNLNSLLPVFGKMKA